jgi:8-oxo-dGTP diphosphatase
MSSSQKLVHVAVGVVRNNLNQVLISLRHRDVHQGGLWEFPGGKVDPGENVQAALCREFKEELGINLTRFFPFKKILHQYSDKKVLLDVWIITAFDGEPQGLEGQKIQWQLAEMFKYDEFPKANRPIIDALRLPLYLPITPQASDFKSLEKLLLQWIKAKHVVAYFCQSQLGRDLYQEWFVRANQLCLKRGLVLLADAEKYSYEDDLSVRGIYVNSKALVMLNERPVAEGVFFAASCHNQKELEKAQRLGVDFVFLSPVKPIGGDRVQGALSWADFESLAQTASLPTYALGGVSEPDLDEALLRGAVGIAGVSAFNNVSI